MNYFNHVSGVLIRTGPDSYETSARASSRRRDAGSVLSARGAPASRERINFRAAARSKRRAKSAPSPAGQSRRGARADRDAAERVRRSSSVPRHPSDTTDARCTVCVTDGAAAVDGREKCARFTRAHAPAPSRESAASVWQRRSTNTRHHHYPSLPPPPPLPGRQRRWVNRRATPDTAVSLSPPPPSPPLPPAPRVYRCPRVTPARCFLSHARARALARVVVTCVNRDADRRR